MTLAIGSTVILGGMAVTVILWAIIKGGSKRRNDLDRADAFAASQARWGYLHDKRGE